MALANPVHMYKEIWRLIKRKRARVFAYFTIQLKGYLRIPQTRLASMDSNWQLSTWDYVPHQPPASRYLFFARTVYHYSFFYDLSTHSQHFLRQTSGTNNVCAARSCQRYVFIGNYKVAYPNLKAKSAIPKGCPGSLPEPEAQEGDMKWDFKQAQFPGRNPGRVRKSTKPWRLDPQWLIYPARVK